MSDDEINFRTFRPGVCSCRHRCRSREEMAALHGDPEAFLASLEKAFMAGDVSFDAAQAANLKYRAEWKAAPEKTEVDK